MIEVLGNKKDVFFLFFFYVCFMIFYFDYFIFDFINNSVFINNIFFLRKFYNLNFKMDILILFDCLKERILIFFFIFKMDCERKFFFFFYIG